MSPEKRRDFESEWGALARRLDRMLARKGIRADRRDDLIQEVALRLISVWDRVDRTRSAWPLTTTIALNLLRDESRSRTFIEVFGDVPELVERHDVERAGIARAELTRVRKAMTGLNPAQRAALLSEVGSGVLPTGTDAEKMVRMRARRRLHELMEKVSAVVAARFRRIAESIHGAIAAGDGLAQGALCIVCILAGISGGLVTLGPIPGDQELRTGVDVKTDDLSIERLAPVRGELRTDSASLRSVSLQADGRDASRKPRTARPSSGFVGAEQPNTSLPSVPLPIGDGDQPVDVPDVPDGENVDVDPPQAPEVPDAPNAPDAPTPDAPAPDAPAPAQLPVEAPGPNSASTLAENLPK